ncbi:MAG: 50S ribosomal protein L24 [Gammaproteobacteria bacterium]|nr:50S ribosomal protein L24 [Gammaproteobacteria bacterium]
MNKIVKGDKVVVLVGRDKGRQGTVEAVRKDGRLIVKDINIVKKHQKPNPMRGVAGGIVMKEAPIQASNVMVVNPETGKGERIGVRVNADGKRERFFKKSGTAVGK